MRALFAVTLFALLLQASGIARAVAATTCTESCPDDDDRGQCPPNCNDCSCCVHVPSGLAARPTFSVTALVASPVRTEYRAAAPPSAEPREILHVPKRLAS